MMKVPTIEAAPFGMNGVIGKIGWFILTTLVAVVLSMVGSWGKQIDTHLGKHDKEIGNLQQSSARTEQQLKDIQGSLDHITRMLERR